MERNFTNENFERFLRQNADGLRMRPSAHVWKGISKQLTKRRRTGFIFAISLLLTTGLVYYFVTNSANNNGFSIAKVNGETKKNLNAGKNQQNLASTTNHRISSGIPVHSALKQTNKVHYAASNSVLTKTNSKTSSLIAQRKSDPFIIDSYSSFSMHPTEFKELIKKSTSLLRASQTTTSEADETTPFVMLKQRKHKVEFQLFFTPTVSYRNLTENKSYMQSVSTTNIPYPYQSLYANINSAVTHKPDFGFEIGGAAKYRVTKNLKITAGIQFNVNRYDIKTFNSTTQLATIALRNRDTLSAVTNYNNLSGYRTNWLHNFYFQVSAPVGIELRLKGDDKMQFGIATTIQPTYILGDRAYLISTDYKNYAEVPWLIRHWNINTNLEPFVAYSTGHLNWQVGPQVRYQLLSSFIKKYPVKENLFDFGLRVGISLNKQ